MDPERARAVARQSFPCLSAYQPRGRILITFGDANRTDAALAIIALTVKTITYIVYLLQL